MAELFPWQVPLADKAEASLRAHRLHILATCTGSGKSYIAAEVARRIDRPLLIVCPKAAITQTRRCVEAMGAAPLLLDVINPAQMVVSKNCLWYNRKKLWTIPKETLVWFDEIHRGASGESSLTTLAVAQLKAFGASLLALSATVACSPMQLRALGYWAGMFRFARGDFLTWCREHGCFPVIVGGRRVLKFTKNRERAAEIMRGIRAEFGDMFQSLGPEDIEGFPDELLETILVDLDKREREEIDDAYASMSERMKTKGKNELAETMKERERIEFALAEAVAERVASDVDDGISPIAFWNFTSSRERFEAKLIARGITDIARVYGNQKDTERQKGIDAFNANRYPVASVNVSAGGVALSMHDILHERQRVSYLIPSYNAAEIKQALGRIRRAEGTAVIQRFVIAAGTLMERVAVALDRKLNNIDLLNDGDLVP